MTAQELDAAILHRKNGDFDAAHAILTRLLADAPDDPILNYHMAWLCDSQGKESDAVPYYERAIRSGLSGEDLRGAMLGLGSTYRCLGEYEKSVNLLREGMNRFPDAREFPTFLAMALYNTGQHHEAMGLLLRTLAETTSDDMLKQFSGAILFYHDKLDETWT